MRVPLALMLAAASSLAGCAFPSSGSASGPGPGAHVQLLVVDDGPREARVNVSLHDKLGDRPVLDLTVTPNGSVERSVPVELNSSGELRLVYTIDDGGHGATGSARAAFDASACGDGAWRVVVTLHTGGDIASAGTSGGCGPR